VADVDAAVDIVSVGLRYRWDDPAVAIPAAPIVRKY
jgi:long-chain fatty acid transport protein